jgi:hypothetical protein
MEECFQNLNRYTYRKVTFTKAWGSWEDDIRMDLKEIGINTRNCVDSAQDRGNWRAIVNAELNLRIP